MHLLQSFSESQRGHEIRVKISNSTPIWLSENAIMIVKPEIEKCFESVICCLYCNMQYSHPFTIHVEKQNTCCKRYICEYKYHVSMQSSR